MAQIVRTDQEIEDVIGAIIDNPGPRYPGMTYEDGVNNALRWVTGEADEHPLED